MSEQRWESEAEKVKVMFPEFGWPDACSFSEAVAEQLTQMTRLPANADRNSAIAQAEWEVVEAAVNARRLYDDVGNTLSRSLQERARVVSNAERARKDLFAAVDRLLSLRQEAEKENAGISAGRSATER